jgi:hypothetical protein
MKQRRLSNLNAFSPIAHLYPHEIHLGYLNKNQYRDRIQWCLEQMGPADYTLSYDGELHQLEMTPTGHNNGWIPMGGSAMAFARVDDLLLFKLTWA